MDRALSDNDLTNLIVQGKSNIGIELYVIIPHHKTYFHVKVLLNTIFSIYIFFVPQ